RLMVDRLAGVLRGLDLGGVVLGQPLLEGLDARREVAHQLGDLAAAAEQHERDHDDEQPMYPAEGTHCVFPPRDRVAPRATRPAFSFRKLGPRQGKNKDFGQLAAPGISPSAAEVNGRPALEPRPIPAESGRALDSSVGACPYRRTGVAFAGTRAIPRPSLPS